MARRHVPVATLSLLFALTQVGLARAQASASGKAAAESLFDQGVKLMKAAKYEEACPTLEESQRVDPGVGTLLYLAECYEKVGRTASAWATFREAASLATTSGQTERAKIAVERAARLEPKLAYVKVTLAGETFNLPGLVVKIGAAEIRPSLQGVSTPVDPGEQRVEVAAPGYDTYTTTLKAEPAGRYDVTVPALHARTDTIALAEAAPAASAVPLTTSSGIAEPVRPSSAPSSAASPWKTVGIAVGGAGLVAVGVGTYFGIRAINKNKDAERACPNTVCQTEQDYELSQQAKDAARVSTITLAAGAAALVGGVVLYVTAPSKREVGLTLTPYAGAHGAGFSLGGRL